MGLPRRRSRSLRPPKISLPKTTRRATRTTSLPGCVVSDAYTVTALTVIAVAWIWEVDMALFQFLLDQPLWHADSQTSVTVGNVALASAVILLGALSWRYMNTLFSVTIFQRMPDDPGVRFAVVTLCRYCRPRR